jgi:transposase
MIVILNTITFLVQIIFKILKVPYYFAKKIFKNQKSSNKSKSKTKKKIVLKRKPKRIKDDEIKS